MEDINALKKFLLKGLSSKYESELSQKFNEVIPIQPNFSMVIPKFILYLLNDKRVGVIQYVKDETSDARKKAITGAIKLYKEWVKTEVKPSRAQFKEASHVINSCHSTSAAHYAVTYGIFYPHATNDPYYSTDAALYAINAALTDNDHARDDAIDETYKKYAAKLLSLLNECKE